MMDGNHVERKASGNMQVKLKILKGSSAGKEIPVRGTKFIIGRAEDASLRPHSDAISRHHCVIVISGEVVGVRDLKSRNGTLVNGEKITSDKRLRSGDILSVGPLEFELLIEREAAVTPPESVGAGSRGAEAMPAAPTNPAAQTKTGGGIGGMVSQWLEEADEFAREEQRLVSPETREYRIDETSRIALEKAAEELKRARSEGTDSESNEGKNSRDQKKGSKKDTGKIPKFAVKVEQPKDTQEAAAQVLRKLFNRGS